MTKNLKNWYSLRVRRVLMISSLSVLAIVGNIKGPGLFWDVRPGNPLIIALMAAFCSGAMLAEGCLLGIWCALGTQPIKYRLPITCGLAAFATWSFALGVRAANGGMTWSTAMIFVLSGLAFFCGMQVPLWVLRAAIGLRIESVAELQDHSLETGQFGIRYLLGLTTGIAVLLVVVKNSLPDDEGGFGRDLGQILLAVAVFVVFSTATALPALGCSLCERARLRWLLCLVGVLTIGPCLVFGLLCIMFGSPPDTAVWVLMIGSVAFGTGGTTTVVLLAARHLEFRVVTHKSEITPLPRR